MKKSIPLIAIILGSIYSLAPDSFSFDEINPAGYEWYFNPYTGHYYAEIDDRRVCWNEAQRVAAELGGYLVSIDDRLEDEWLYNLMCDIHPREIWIGLYREGGIWKWDSGDSVQYTNWNPIGWVGDSAVLNTPDRGWFERPSGDLLPLIVEREESVPTPTPTLSTVEPLPSNYEWEYNPENGHYYAIVFEPATWQGAFDRAKSLNGYPVTIRSDEEANFVHQMLDRRGYHETWMGLRKNNTWQWITSEELNYSAWLPGEPSGDGEYGLLRYSGWNDAPSTFIPECFVVEREGNLPLPAPTPETPLAYPWHVNPHNGHSYTLVPDISSWEQGIRKAEKLGGYLACITSKQEDDWITETFSSSNYRSACIGLMHSNSQWYWINGDPVNYLNWSYHEPYPSELDVNKLYVGKNLRKGLYNNQWDAFVKWDEIAPAILVEKEDGLPMPTPSPTPSQIAGWSFSGDSLEENGFVADAPVGYKKGNLSLGEIPGGIEADRRGMCISIKPGEGIFALSRQSIDVISLANIWGTFRASNNNISLALIALNHDLDGQYGYSNLLYQEIPVKNYRNVHLVYSPPSGKIRIAIQAINPPYASQSTDLWVDRLTVSSHLLDEKSESMEDVPLEVNGTFNGGLEKLIFNINGADGTVLPFFQTKTDVAIRMMLEPTQLAVNIGTYCLDVYDRFPFSMLGWIHVKRDSMPGRGTVGMVVTNGMQNLGVFRLADGVRDVNDPNEDYLTIGGDFSVNNPDMPIAVFVQLGGPDANTSVIVDDLTIVKNKKID